MSMHGGGTAQVCERTFLPLVAMLHGSCFLVGAGVYQIKPELVQASTAIDVPSATEMRPPLPCRSTLVCAISPGKDRRNGESKQAEASKQAVDIFGYSQAQTRRSRCGYAVSCSVSSLQRLPAD